MTGQPASIAQNDILPNAVQAQLFCLSPEHRRLAGADGGLMNHALGSVLLQTRFAPSDAVQEDVVLQAFNLHLCHPLQALLPLLRSGARANGCCVGYCLSTRCFLNAPGLGRSGHAISGWCRGYQNETSCVRFGSSTGKH